MVSYYHLNLGRAAQIAVLMGAGRLKTVSNRAFSGARMTLESTIMPTSGSVTGGVPMLGRSCAVGTTASARSLRIAVSARD